MNKLDKIFLDMIKMELYSLTYRKSKFNGGVIMKKWMSSSWGCVMAEVLAMNLSTDKISCRDSWKPSRNQCRQLILGYYTVGENSSSLGI